MIVEYQDNRTADQTRSVEALPCDHSAEEVWWPVIEVLADFVACGVDYDELEDEFVQEALTALGFDTETINQALDWLEKASMSGHVTEVFSMLQPVGQGPRIASPLEKIGVSEKVMKKFATMRYKGLISSDLAERVLEGVRAMDTRDWDDEDISSFFFDIISASLPQHSDRLVEKLISAKNVPEFYS